ncbi:hypothetical protein DAI22_12g192400 [Oryza sativa Japonica Group]|nr:hypothetical protein DAI22_12g192400 [Oryza sativa Japonica Group]
MSNHCRCYQQQSFACIMCPLLCNEGMNTYQLPMFGLGGIGNPLISSMWLQIVENKRVGIPVELDPLSRWLWSQEGSHRAP